MANFKEDLAYDIEDNSEKVNYSDDSDKNNMQYIIIAYFFNKSFIHPLITRDFLLLSKFSEAQYFILDCYIEKIF